MTIVGQRMSLVLRTPFKISYGATTVRENVLVRLDDGTHTALGEAAVVPYYHETAERVLAYLADPQVIEAVGGDALLLEDMLNTLPLGESSAARAGVDIALHDLWGKTLGQPLYRLWGLNPARCPASSFTVSIPDDEAQYRERLRGLRDYAVLKLKLGSGSWETDLGLVQTARREYGGQLCVDANNAWSPDDALKIIPQLGELGVMFVEQPVARADYNGWRTLRARLPVDSPPLIADESVQGVESIFPLAGLVDGINIKLAKCGGLRPARRLIALARSFGMKVMIGCMVESSIAVTAAAHLAPLADYADLDANLLIANDPYRGVQMVAGQLTLPDGPGLGVTPVA